MFDCFYDSTLSHNILGLNIKALQLLPSGNEFYCSAQGGRRNERENPASVGFSLSRLYVPMVGILLYFIKRNKLGTSLAVQWLRLHTSNTEGVGSMPGQETKILYATWPKINSRLYWSTVSSQYKSGGNPIMLPTSSIASSGFL